MVASWDALIELMAKLGSAEDPETEIQKAIKDATARFVSHVRRFTPLRLIETARLALLPLASDGGWPVTEAGAAQLELLALLTLAAQRDTADDQHVYDEAQAQEMSAFVSTAKEDVEELLRLAQVRSYAVADPSDELALVSLLIRSSEVWMRNSSYPEMVEKTYLELLDGEPSVRTTLNSELGFDATDALAVLGACHLLQMDSLNARINAMRDATTSAMTADQAGQLDDELTERVRARILDLFEPDAVRATVAVEDVVERTGITAERVAAVVEHFRLDLGTMTPLEVLDAFATGRNPMRMRPLIVADDGRIMLVHPALSVFAVRESLEAHLKTSRAWNQYAKHRGDLLEIRTRAALGRVLPSARYRDGFRYYVPVDDAERRAGDPAKYTKRVEGDHLIVLDDVAIIVEDKAVALSALARGGKTNRVRTDLTGIITKAAEQAGRMRDGIERDGGLRIEGEGWVDLSDIREIHTIAVSLDDLSTVMTATAELVKAGLLDLDNIPWTVSLHDLELITELVARPAEFLLYLRRRRNPDVTTMFSAPDEMDLFLYFFEAGLWVEPDPAKVHAAFPFRDEPTTAELRRYRRQQPAILSSRTDALDAWFYLRERGETAAAAEARPAMVPSPLEPLIDELQSRGTTGWLSTGATMLAMETSAQDRFARHADNLLDNPSPDGTGRSITITVTASVDPAEGWLFVWATSPVGEATATAEKRARDYLRAKKHQLGLPRGAVFLYDEPTRDFVGAVYDGHIGPLDSSLTATLNSLRPISDMQRTLHPNARHPVRAPQRNPGKSS
jgi:hypothetical protein